MPPPPPPRSAPRPAKPCNPPAAASVAKGGGLGAGLEAVVGKLKSVETRVRQRDGTVLVEQRGQDGFTSEVRGRDDTKPQYVEDQEHGLSRLTPKVFDEGTHRWRPVDAVTPVTHDDAARLNEAELSQHGRLRLITYNVWFSEYRQWTRARAVFEILKSIKADIVCLQEVTPKFLAWLREEDFVQTLYALSDSVGTTLRGSELAYGVVLLVRRGLHVSRLHLYELPSQMSRAVLVASLPLPTHELRVATVHLESLDATNLRIQQLKRICQILIEGEEQGPACSSSSILCGDMNFDDGAPEEQVLCQAEFVDSANCGCTMPYDDVRGKPVRIDRVFVRSTAGSWRLLPGPSQRFGEAPAVDPERAEDRLNRGDSGGAPDDSDGSETDPNMPSLVSVPPGHVPPRWPTCPSDHFGLVCQLELVQRKAVGARHHLAPL